MNPEDKAVSVVNKVIVPTSMVIYIQDDFRELIHDNTVCINRLLDKFHGIKQDLFAVELVTDIALGENTLRKSP